MQCTTWLVASRVPNLCTTKTQHMQMHHTCVHACKLLPARRHPPRSNATLPARTWCTMWPRGCDHVSLHNKSVPKHIPIHQASPQLHAHATWRTCAPTDATVSLLEAGLLVHTHQRDHAHPHTATLMHNPTALRTHRPLTCKAASRFQRTCPYPTCTRDCTTMARMWPPQMRPCLCWRRACLCRTRAAATTAGMRGACG